MKRPMAQYHLPLGVMVAAVVLLAGAVLPHTRRLHAVHAECTALREALATQDAQVQSVGAAARAVADGRAQLAAFEEAVPRGKQLGALLGTLDQLAQAKGLSDLQVRPAAPVAGAPVACLPIEVEFTGSFAAAYAFLRDVEALPRVAWVQRFELSHTGDLVEDLHGAVTLLAYYRPEAEERP